MSTQTAPAPTVTITPESAPQSVMEACYPEDRRRFIFRWTGNPDATGSRRAVEIRVYHDKRRQAYAARATAWTLTADGTATCMLLTDSATLSTAPAGARYSRKNLGAFADGVLAVSTQLLDAVPAEHTVRIAWESVSADLAAATSAA